MSRSSKESFGGPPLDTVVKKTEELGFTEFLDCSICGNPYIPPENEKARKFWLTTCRHILCDDHVHTSGECTHCGKTGIGTTVIDDKVSREPDEKLINQNPGEASSLFMSFKTHIAGIAYQCRNLEFQYDQLVGFARRQREQNDISTRRLEEVSEKNRELGTLFGTIRDELANAAKLSEENKALKIEKDDLKQKLVEALQRVVQLTNPPPTPYTMSHTPVPMPMGMNGYSLRPASVAPIYYDGHPNRVQNGYQQPMGYRQAPSMPTVYEGNEEGEGYDGYYGNEGGDYDHNLNDGQRRQDEQGEPNGYEGRYEDRASAKRRRIEESNAPLSMTTPKPYTHSRSEAASWTENPVATNFPARLSLRPESHNDRRGEIDVPGSSSKVKTNLDKYRLDTRKSNNTPHPKPWKAQVVITQDQNETHKTSHHFNRGYKPKIEQDDGHHQYQDRVELQDNQDRVQTYQAPQASSSSHVPSFLERQDEE